MKSVKVVFLVGLIMALLHNPVLTGAAQGDTNKITFEPGTLSLSSVRGATETRTIHISANEDLTTIEFLPVDLVGKDNARVIASNRIKIDGIPDVMKVNDLTPIKVTIGLIGIKSGDYTGRLAVKHDTGIQYYDMTVNVKDPVFWPLVFILLGTFIGRSLMSYKEVGQQRDRVLARIGNITQQLNNDPGLESVAFYNEYLRAKLKVVEDLSNSKDWKAANDTLAVLEGSMNRWLQFRSSWIQLSNEMSNIGKKIEEIGNNQTPYLKSVYKLIDDASRVAPEEPDPDHKGPENLAERLTEAQTYLYKYKWITEKLDRLNDLINKMKDPTGDVNAYKSKSITLRQRLEILNPAQTQEYENLNTEIDTLTSEVKSLGSIPDGRDVSADASNLVEQAQKIILNLPYRAYTPTWAKFRLDVIPWLAYGFLILLLAGAGFKELYFDNPTFGSNLVGDYLSLLSWGLAAEATREGLSSVARGLSVPSFREE